MNGQPKITRATRRIARIRGEAGERAARSTAQYGGTTGEDPASQHHEAREVSDPRRRQPSGAGP